jgi:hypothetical protein
VTPPRFTSRNRLDRRGAGRIALLACAAASILTPPASAAGQTESLGPRLGVDVEVYYLSGRLQWPTRFGWALGGEIGAGVNEQVATFAPARDDFLPFLHLGVVASRDLSPRMALDLGARLGFGDILGPCDASDCLPEGFTALMAGLDAGFDALRAGTRIYLGRQSGHTIVAWSPLFLRLRL